MHTRESTYTRGEAHALSGKQLNTRGSKYTGGIQVHMKGNRCTRGEIGAHEKKRQVYTREQVHMMGNKYTRGMGRNRWIRYETGAHDRKQAHPGEICEFWEKCVHSEGKYCT